MCVHQGRGPKAALTPTLSYHNLLLCRVPINSILGFIIRTYKKVGYGSLRYILPKPTGLAEAPVLSMKPHATT